MSTKDIRIQEPLFNIAFLVLFIGTFSGASYSFKYLDIEMQNQIILGLEKINFIPIIISAICLILSIILISSYILKVRKYNVQNPSKKLKAFTAFTLNEFNDDDELFSKVTNEATRKVYVYYTYAITFFAFLLIFQFSYYVYITIVLSLGIIQNIIYFAHMKKYYH